jgi:hypothetical protein
MKPDSGKTPPPPASREGQQADPATPVADTATGLPWLRTWPRVYWFVLGCFALWVVLFAVFERLFA